jgi:hypothetical protein
LLFERFESSLEQRNHFYTGCPSYILEYNLGDITTVQDMGRCRSGVVVVPFTVGPLVSYNLDFIQRSVRGYKL